MDGKVIHTEKHYRDGIAYVLEVLDNHDKDGTLWGLWTCTRCNVSQENYTRHEHTPEEAIRECRLGLHPHHMIEHRGAVPGRDD